MTNSSPQNDSSSLLHKPVMSDKAFMMTNAVVSSVAVVFLYWLLVVHQGQQNSVDVSFMPAMNALLNATSATLLVLAWRAIRRGNRMLHRRLVTSAFCCSALFLIGYIIYHSIHGDTRYPHEGADKVIYLVILASHVLLSISVLPLALTCFWLAYREKFALHKKVARWAMPIWLYVSVTGVLIFAMLKIALAS